MARESANKVLRQIQTLFALGTVGGLSDAQLVEQFLGRDGAEREDAFAALVQRHGPMVLSVCRRMLPGSADAEDAFQAVFLVLARKAGAVRRVDGLQSWLYGVAVRTAKEARRRSAKQRAREGGAMVESAAVSEPDEGRGDLLALLDEEIDRLPSRYREALMLCELEGVSRQDAARQLGLPEGTLSSRLSRGRSLLRDRLARRGVELGAGLVATLIAEPANAGLSEPLAAVTVRLALEYGAQGAAAGAVPVAVVSLAERVLGMLTVAKLKLILVATVTTLGAVGFALAVGPKQGGLPREVESSAAVEAPKVGAIGTRAKPQPILARGVVVDEAGRPVAGAKVRADAFTDREVGGITSTDGAFALPIRRQQIDGTTLHVRSANGNQIGIFRYDDNMSRAMVGAPARVVLKSNREVNVRVADSSKAPELGATVEVIGSFGVYDSAATGRDGFARLRIPADAMVEWVVALKSGRGFDYAEYGPIDEAGRPRGGVPAAELPQSVSLTLDGARIARIKAVDSGGEPLAGVGFYLWMMHKEGRRSYVNYASRIFTATTGTDGVAVIDWLPPVQHPLSFWPSDAGYAHRRVLWEEGQAAPVIAKLSPSEAICGRVVSPDGAPSSGIKVRAQGTGKGLDQGGGWTRTVADGSYVISASAGEAYAVFIDDEDWAAPSRFDVVVREGKWADGINFKLTRGTVIRGLVTLGSNHQPAPDVSIELVETGGAAPAGVLEEGDFDFNSGGIRRHFATRTDSTGHYSVRVGPGTYSVRGPERTEDEEIAINDEVELVRDFRVTRPRKGQLTGRVVLAGTRDKGVAGATVEIIAANERAVSFTVTTDGEGRFRTERELDRLVLCAKNADGTLGAIVEAGAEDPDVVLAVAPTATTTGLLLDKAGKPAAKVELAGGCRVRLDDTGSQITRGSFASKVVTDAEGRFTLPSLVVGQAYDLSTLYGKVYPETGAVRPKAPGLIDLGTLQIGVYRPSATGAKSFSEEDASSYPTQRDRARLNPASQNHSGGRSSATRTGGGG